MKLTDEQKKAREENLVKLQASMKLLADMGAESASGEGEGEDKGCCKCEELECMCQNLYYAFQYAMEEIQYLGRYVDSVERELYAHESNGHLPAVKSTEQMARAVDALGLNKEYDVQKRTLYAKRGGDVMVLG